MQLRRSAVAANLPKKKAITVVPCYGQHVRTSMVASASAASAARPSACATLHTLPDGKRLELIVQKGAEQVREGALLLAGVG